MDKSNQKLTEQTKTQLNTIIVGEKGTLNVKGKIIKNYEGPIVDEKTDVNKDRIDGHVTVGKNVNYKIKIIENTSTKEIKFNVNGKYLKINREVCKKVPEFEKIFEREDNLVNDVEVNVFQVMLNFIENDKIDQNLLKEDNFAINLLKATSKYSIFQLHKLTEDYLCEQIDDNNVKQFEQLAQNNNAKKLNEKVKEYKELFNMS